MAPIESLRNYAKKIAAALDKKDNLKGKIDDYVWNSVFKVKEKQGTKIRKFITLENAEKSILTYLIRCEKDKTKRQDLAEKWLNELSEKADIAAEQEEQSDIVRKSDIPLDFSLGQEGNVDSPVFLSNEQPEQTTVQTEVMQPDSLPLVAENLNDELAI